MQMDLFLLLLITVLSAIAPETSEALNVRGHLLKSGTFLSPPFYLRPGSVVDKYFFDIPFPRGHIALKSFDAEVVDGNGTPVPLYHTYLHHWVVEPYYSSGSGASSELSGAVLVRNSGVCSRDTLGQYYGLGSETRRTATWVPDPYGIEAGNPEKALAGMEERWLLNVHAIDTRGVIDRSGCTECRCILYNVSRDAQGRNIPADYAGGLRCCYDETQCPLREGFSGETRELFLRYTVKWLDWSEAIRPVRIYIFDVTDTALAHGRSESSCKVEYDVKECSSNERAKNKCVDVKTARAIIPRGGDIVYGVAHQHASGIGAALYGQVAITSPM